MAHRQPDPVTVLSRASPSVILYATLALAAFFRLWGIDFGLPYDGITYDALTIEEIQEVHRALKLGAGEYSSVFGKGGLYLILFVEYGVLFVISWLLGWVESGREFAIQALQDRTAIYVLGRVTVALMGLATCYVTYRIARHIHDERTALFAALIGAVAYFHAVFSAVINVDIGATLALWLSLLVYLRHEETGKTRYLVAAGAIAAIAIAFKFPGAVALPLIWVAMFTAPSRNVPGKSLIRDSLIIGVSAILTLTLIAPEWLTSIAGLIRYNFMGGVQASQAATDPSELRGAIKSITVMRSEWSPGYLKHLVSEYNVALTATAVFGAVMGVFSRNRWDRILAGLVVLFIVVMSLSDRTQPERYLLPVVPALWLLGSRGLAALGKYRRWLPAVGLAVVVAVPTFWLVRAAVEKSKLDTRILAKHWIEANVPAGARILMDGMRYRFSQGPPLNPDRATVEEKVDRAIAEGGNFGRGVSEYALSVYEEAMVAVEGPKYELVSTVHGLEVRDINYYVDECFDYIVTSAMIAGRFRPGAPAHRMFPDSARFYSSLEADPRVRLVHEEVAAAWAKSGPTIRIFKVESRCG
jgi:hypothetical protein